MELSDSLSAVKKHITACTSKSYETGRGNSMFTFALLLFTSSYQHKITTTTSFQYRDEWIFFSIMFVVSYVVGNSLLDNPRTSLYSSGLYSIPVPLTIATVSLRLTFLIWFCFIQALTRNFLLPLPNAIHKVCVLAFLFLRHISCMMVILLFLYCPACITGWHVL